MMFKHAIVRRPGRSIEFGLSRSDYGKPDYEHALQQHNLYVEALKKCGVQVTIMKANERYPDSVFIEDTAVLTEKCAIIANPGAFSRQGEEMEVKEELKKFYKNIETLFTPGTLDGGDVMRVGNHFFIGLSERTNMAGTQQLKIILEKYGFRSTFVEFEEMLHLKSGVSYLTHNNLLITGEFLENPIFGKFTLIPVEEDEDYAANSIWVNGFVLVPSGFPNTRKAIEKVGYKVIEVDVSEFQKLDGGLSCLSLRF
jgi:dimethylargininase